MSSGSDEEDALDDATVEKACSLLPPSPVKRAVHIESSGSVDDVSAAAAEKRLATTSGTGLTSPPVELMSPIKRQRVLSTSEQARPPVLTSGHREIYTRGRPPWFRVNSDPNMKEKAFLIGLTGGSASGKTTVAARIIEMLDLHWVILLSMDSFYKVLTPEQSALAHNNEYNFDHPDAFDFDLLIEKLQNLKHFKRTEVPQYDFTTHSRLKDWKTYYGANVILFEGIMAFVNKDVRDLLDLKIFVDTDSDVRLCRRLSRDISQRGRDLRGVLKQYHKFVKPAFDNYIEPTKAYADIVVPRGAENEVAIDIIVKLVKNKFEEAGHPLKADLDFLDKQSQQCYAQPYLLPVTNSVKALHTKMRNKDTPRDQFIFYTLRLMRLLVEFSLSLLPYEPVSVNTINDNQYQGKRFRGSLSAVSVIRAGETLEQAVTEVVKNVRVGKLLIQTNQDTQNPELYYIRLPKDIRKDHVLLLDPTVATGAAVMMAIRILLDHEVPEERIILLTVLVSRRGLNAVSYVYPRVNIVTSAIDHYLSDSQRLVPGLGSAGDRFFGTDN